MAGKVRRAQPGQGELFQTCAICGGERVFKPSEVAPVEVMRLPDGRVLVCLYDGRRTSIWLELSQSLRRWLGIQMLKGLWTRRTVRQVRECRYAERVRIRRALGLEEVETGG